MEKKLLFFILLGISITLFSQTGPGGVTPNLRGWYKASVVTLTAGKVSTWNDQSTLLTNFTNATAAQQPTVLNNTFNYNPALVFDGLNTNLTSATDLMANATTSLSIFAVANLDGTVKDTWGTVFEGQGDATWNSGGYGLAALSSGNTSFGCFVRDWDVNFVTASTAVAPISKGSILSGIWNGGANLNKVDYRWNGVSQGTDNYAPGSVGDNGISTIGGAPSTSYNFYGKIAEIAVYNTGLTTAQINKVESYFAVKYGITLGSNGSAVAAYTSSAGTTIWTSASGYHYDVAAIGAESTSGLQQNISSSLNVPSAAGATDMPFIIAQDLISAPTNVGDGTYIIAGHNNASLSGAIVAYTHGGSAIQVQQNRLFRIQTTNLTGGHSMMAMTDLEIQFDMSKVPGNGGGFGLAVGVNNPANLRLLLDDNTTFGQGTANEKSYSNSGVAGNVIKFQIPVADLPINGVYFFRIGSTSYSSAPLPIELMSFNAILNSDHVDLTWETATETNNDFFTIERSKDGINFENVFDVKGAGNSTSPINYMDIDPNPFTGISYYRLKQTDFNGQSSYSNIVPVAYNPSGDASISLFPNPTDSETPASVSLNKLNGQEVLVVLRDIAGNEVYSKLVISSSDKEIVALDPEGKLAKGTYLVIASSENKFYSKKLIIK